MRQVVGRLERVYCLLASCLNAGGQVGQTESRLRRPEQAKTSCPERPELMDTSFRRERISKSSNAPRLNTQFEAEVLLPRLGAENNLARSIE